MAKYSSDRELRELKQLVEILERKRHLLRYLEPRYRLFAEWILANKDRIAR